MLQAEGAQCEWRSLDAGFQSWFRVVRPLAPQPALTWLQETNKRAFWRLEDLGLGQEQAWHSRGPPEARA